MNKKVYREMIMVLMLACLYLPVTACAEHDGRQVVTALGQYPLDLPDQGIECTLNYERHDLSVTMDGWNKVCPIVYDLPILSGNMPGIDAINAILYQDYQSFVNEVHGEYGVDSFIQLFDLGVYEDDVRPYEYLNKLNRPVYSYGEDLKSGLQFYDGRYLSILFYQSCFTGESGWDYPYGLTFDLQTGKQVSIADLFGNARAVRSQIVTAVIDNQSSELNSYEGVVYDDEADFRADLERMDLTSENFIIGHNGMLYIIGHSVVPMVEPIMPTGLTLGVDKFEDDIESNEYDGEKVKLLGHYQLDIPDRGIELTLTCERHDFTQYVGNQSMECPMVYDHLILTGNLPGIDAINDKLNASLENYRESNRNGFESYLQEAGDDPYDSWFDTVKINEQTGYGDITITSGLQFYDGHYISILFDTLICGGGTAVENNAWCRTFDLQSGEEVGLDDLFDDSQSFRNALADRTMSTLASWGVVDQLYDDIDTTLAKMDLSKQSFFLSSSGELILCFGEYDLGEGALGSPMIATGIRLGDSLASETDDGDADKQNGDTEEAVIYYADGSLKISDVLGNQSLDEYIVASKSTQYNPKLAYILSALSRSAYNKDHTDYLGRTLDSLGFTEKKPFNYGDDEGFASHYIAKKRLPDGRLLVVIVVRGTYNIPNFVSDIAATPSNLVTGFHSGFEESEMKVYKDLEGFLGSTIPTSNVIYVVTGHSLGAAVCNLLSVKLSDAGVPASCVFDYNFACPDVARGMGSRWNFFGEHNNMFNLADARDPVSYVPGVALDVVTWWNWTFTWGKYGRSYWFSYDWSNPDEVNLDLSFGVHDLGNYMYYFSLMNDTSNFKEWSGAKAAQTSANFDALVEQMKFF